MSDEATITQFEKIRILVWVFPLFLVGIVWIYARFFPTTNMTGYALQAIFLSTPPYLCLVFPFYTVLLWRRRLGWYSVFGFVLWVGVGIPDQGAGTGARTILVANVNAFSGNEELLQKELSEGRDSFIIQIERRVQSIPNMKRVGYDKKNKDLRVSHYSEVYCVHDCQAAVTDQIGSQTMAMPIALLRLEDRVCVVGIHAPPPLPVDPTGMKPYLDYLADHISEGIVVKKWLVCRKGDRVLLMGDLNAVPHSVPYRRLLDMGFVDVRAQSGIWGATWPMEGFYSPLPVFRLDHIMVGGGLQLSGWESVSISNSDHRGLRVWF